MLDPSREDSADSQRGSEAGVTFETRLTDSPEEAAAFVRRGLPVAFPTETVYGLGASVYDEQAIRRIYEAKGRPPSNPLIAHVASRRQIDELAARIPPAAERLIKAFFPGPLTLVLPRRETVPPIATAGLETVGVRMPDHPIARVFIEAVGSPVVAPSANRSGRPSPTTWQAVQEDLGGRIACILTGGRTRAGLESTVVDCTGDIPVILRPGSVTEEQLRRVAPQLHTRITHEEQLARSPGTRFRHYAPEGDVILVDDPADARDAAGAAYIGIKAPTPDAPFGLIRICEDEAKYAFELFDFLRECDRRKIQRIYCQRPGSRDIGAALLDRLDRASRGA